MGYKYFVVIVSAHKRQEAGLNRPGARLHSHPNTGPPSVCGLAQEGLELVPPPVIRQPKSQEQNCPPHPGPPLVVGPPLLRKRRATHERSRLVKPTEPSTPPNAPGSQESQQNPARRPPYLPRAPPHASPGPSSQREPSPARKWQSGPSRQSGPSPRAHEEALREGRHVPRARVVPQVPFLRLLWQLGERGG